MFKTILVAVKFSAAGARTLETAVKLAKSHNAHLYLFHGMDYRIPPDQPDLIEQQQAIEERMKRDFKALLNEMAPLTFAIYPADPAMEVCKLAHRIEADLIVLGCHQRTGITAMGRVDYVGMTILEKAPCPVMLIPHF